MLCPGLLDIMEGEEQQTSYEFDAPSHVIDFNHEALGEADDADQWFGKLLVTPCLYG